MQAAAFMYRAFHQLIQLDLIVRYLCKLINLQRYVTIKSNDYGNETKQKYTFSQSYARTTKKQRISKKIYKLHAKYHVKKLFTN